MWSKHELGDCSLEGRSLEVEEIERKDEPKHYVKKIYFSFIDFIY